MKSMSITDTGKLVESSQKTVTWEAIPMYDADPDWQLFDLWWVGEMTGFRMRIESALTRSEVMARAAAKTQNNMDYIIIWK